MSYKNNPKYKRNKELAEIEKHLEKLQPLLESFWSHCPDEVCDWTDYCRYKHAGKLLYWVQHLCEVTGEELDSFPILREEDKEKQGQVEDVFAYCD